MTDERWTRWTTADITAATEAAVRTRRERVEAVLALSGGRTFDNTVVALERASGDLDDLHNRLQLLMSAHPDAEARSAAQAAYDRISDDTNEVAHDRRIWDAVQAVGDAAALEGPDRKLYDDTVRDLKRTGFHLPADRFAKLKANRAELARLESAFEKAINDWEDGITVTGAQLDGLPPAYREGLTRDGDGYRVTLAYPDLFPFLRLAHDDAGRRELAHKALRRGGEANLERLAAMVRLRQENAMLLGYPTHADFVTGPRMAKSRARVAEFLGGLITKLVPAQRAELRDLIRFKKEELKLDHPAPLHHHELMYWGERFRKARYAFDSEELKQYFPLEKVREGMFGIYQDLLGVRFTAVGDAPVWHPDVTCWQVTDAAAGTPLGIFYLDLFPREGKYGHAAAFPLAVPRPGEAGSVALVCNFPKPTPSNPSLMDHGEVETILHEFGHLMHGLLSGGAYASQNGLGVTQDFVEAPSQMLEEWAWDRRSLARLSGHHATGEPLPDALAEKLLASRRFLQAGDYLGQAVMALYDLRMHGQPADAPVEASHIARMHRDMKLEYEAIDLPDDAIKAAGWTHLADYDAAYYGYLWSKVYALDLFTRFAANPLDAGTGAAYRSEILAPGASRDEEASVRAFLGRESSDAAFLAALGVH